MKPRKTFQNLSKEKQERITRIAIEEFGNKGFDGASINAMVGRMEIAKGSIFQYFGDKKGLFLFVFNRSVDLVKGYLRTVRDQSSDENLATRLNKTLSAGIAFIKNHPLLYRLYMKVLFEPKAPFRDEILISLRHHSTEYLKSLLENALIKKELNKNIDLNQAAFVLDAIMDRFLSAHTIKHLDSGLGIYDAPLETTEIWIAEITKMICTGIAKSDFSEKNQSELIKEPYILILAAVDEELSGLIQNISHPDQSIIGKRNIISGTVGNVHVKLLASGPGIVNTAQALTAMIESAQPRLIVQTGCAGAFRQSGLKIGDIGIATQEIDIHTGLESSSESCVADELPFALIKTTKNKSEEVKNRYPINDDLVNHAYQILQSDKISLNFQIKKGVFITVSTITTTNKRADALLKKFNPCMEQMEGAAAAHIAIIYNIPFIEIRSASNFVGKRDTDLWDLDLAFKNASDAVYKFIQEVKLDKLNY
ncbi:MAG: futalosine hydrolase [Desulfobacteraceae bacterium]|nr:futalosine hydrolase [Desulfobacteraceae bacterium]MBC2755851.1 futalosine hydrolase [Desulfobacteraceae bacterium]